MRRVRLQVRIIAVVILAAVLLPALLAACPLCKEATDAGQAGTSLWRGMYWSIILMMSMPFAMVGTVILLVLRARRRHRAAVKPPSRSLRPDSRGARS